MVLKRTDPVLWPEANRILIPFVENKGQLKETDVLFYSSTFACMVSVNNDGTIGYRLAEDKTGEIAQPVVIRERVAGVSKTAPSGEQKAVAKVSCFRGRDPERWVKDISTFNAVDMGEIYEGIRLNLQARGNNVEKIFHIRPTADPKKIRVRIDGAEALKLTPEGELEVHTRAGRMRFSKPVAYQTAGGRKILVEVAYKIIGNTYGFQVGAYDQTKELFIDPLITAIFTGSTDETTRPSCMTADNQGNIYVAGYSAGQLAVFKFDSKLETMLGSALFATKYWSNSNVYDIAVDNQGAVYLAGRTRDENFPVTQGAFDTEFKYNQWGQTSEEGFVIKFNADLNTILAATFIGAGEPDAVFGLAIAPNGSVYVAGEAGNPVYKEGISPFPTTPGAYDTNPGHHMKTKAFIARLDSGLQTLQASTLLGYNGDVNKDDYQLDDCAYDVAIDGDGNIVVTGMTESERFPLTANCADATFQGKSEVFISKFDPDLQELLASTFLGGANAEQPNVLAIDPNNEIVVAGWTLSSDFPVVQGNFDTSYNLYEDGFVSRLNSELTTIEASTFVGGQGADQICDMVIHEDGTVLLCGGTGSSDFPVTDKSYDPSFNGGYTNDFYKGDGFLTILDQQLTTLAGSTFLGGGWYDHASSIVINNEDIVLAGETWSTNFPYMVERTGDSDAFVCRFNATEEPNPLPTARPGHWRSKNGGTASSLHLDINICKNGSFSGWWQMYLCILNTGCYISDEITPEPISGTIDFKKNTGTIDIGEECKGIPISIFKQTPDELMININPGAKTDDCFGSTGSHMYYQGESDDGNCSDDPIDPDPVGGSGSDGGGGGGCFINMAVDSL
jgi:hypothetical protein